MNRYAEEDYLQVSGLQHFSFCRRQWALIHIEQLWTENLHTVSGMIFHDRAHNDGLTEKRGDLITVRGLPVFSPTLGVSGKCDIVEFHADPEGVALNGRRGKWLPMPVEYKKGRAKEHDADRLQLCCQAMCLEEMLCCTIESGCLFYGETKRRELVPLTAELRAQVESALLEMHALYRRRYTPRAKPTKSCKACSLCNLCLPALQKQAAPSAYITAHLTEDAS